jgi:hypothetical protein
MKKRQLLEKIAKAQVTVTEFDHQEPLTQAELSELCEVLRANNTLSSLSISGSHINDNGATLLADILKTN